MNIEYTDNNYKLTFDISSQLLDKIMNIHFFELFFDLNKNMIETINIENVDSNKYTIILLLKHYFKELGVKQKYLKLNLIHDITNECFIIQTNNLLFMEIIKNTELLNIDIFFKYNKITDSRYLFVIKVIKMDTEHLEDIGIEKMIGKIIIKIFNNLKEYIEKNTC
jgi:hypothetical protein